jgi:hypothetical protein
MAYQGNTLTRKRLQQVLARRSRQGRAVYRLAGQHRRQELSRFRSTPPGAMIQPIEADLQML